MPILLVEISSIAIFSPFDKALSCSNFSAFSKMLGLNLQNLAKFAFLQNLAHRSKFSKFKSIKKAHLAGLDAL